jgi:hypothetical protein
MSLFDDAAKQRLYEILDKQHLFHHGAGLIRNEVLRVAVPLREQGFTKLKIDEICSDSFDKKLNAIQAANGFSSDAVREGIHAALAAVQACRLDETLH